MAQPYVGEIRMFAGNFAPAGWMFCDGTILPVFEYETLAQIIGASYGGDGVDTFALPDLRGRIPIHMGAGYVLAETGGVEEVTLTPTQIPAHKHALVASADAGTQANASGMVLAANNTVKLYSSAAPTALTATAIGLAGGSLPHSNMQPYLCVNFIISLYGIYPTTS